MSFEVAVFLRNASANHILLALPPAAISWATSHFNRSLAAEAFRLSRAFQGRKTCANGGHRWFY